MKTVWVQITNHGTNVGPFYKVYSLAPLAGPYPYSGNINIPLAALVGGINFTTIPDAATQILIIEVEGCDNVLFINIATTTTTTTLPCYTIEHELFYDEFDPYIACNSSIISGTFYSSDSVVFSESNTLFATPCVEDPYSGFYSDRVTGIWKEYQSGSGSFVSDGDCSTLTTTTTIQPTTTTTTSSTSSTTTTTTTEEPTTTTTTTIGP